MVNTISAMPSSKVAVASLPVLEQRAISPAPTRTSVGDEAVAKVLCLKKETAEDKEKRQHDDQRLRGDQLFEKPHNPVLRLLLREEGDLARTFLISPRVYQTHRRRSQRLL